MDSLKGDKKKSPGEVKSAPMSLPLIPWLSDHRTNYEVAQVDKVMDGDIDGFIDAYLKWRSNNLEESTRKE